MIQHRLALQLNSLMFSADRRPQRIAIGLVAALIVAPSMSAFPATTMLAAMLLLLPRRAIS